MHVFLIILFFLIFIISFVNVKDIFHPSLLCLFSWIVILILYLIIGNNLNKLSQKFYVVLFLWISTFALGGFIGCKFTHKSKKIKTYITTKNYQILTGVFIFVFSIGIIKLFHLSRHSEFSIVGYIRNIALGKSEKLPFFLTLFQVFVNLGFSWFYYSLYLNKKIKLFAILFFISILLLGSKSVIFSLIISMLYYLLKTKKLNFKYILILFLLCSLSVLVVVGFRDSHSSVHTPLLEMMQIYFLSPLPAFDLILNNKIPYNCTNGVITFGLMFRILDKFGIPVSIIESGVSWCFVPVPTNVYTVMLTGFLDYGEIGMFVFSFLYGCFNGFLYKKSINSLGFSIFYAIFAQGVFFQFFADFIFPYLSIYMQLALFLFFITKFKTSKTMKLLFRSCLKISNRSCKCL